MCLYAFVEDSHAVLLHASLEENQHADFAVWNKTKVSVHEYIHLLAIRSNVK